MLSIAAFILLQLALEVSNQMDVEEEESFTEDALTNCWEKVAVLSTFFATIGIEAENGGQWWVRERSLVWWDYFLSISYEDERWIRIMRLPCSVFESIV
ncbi:hypothetical protein R1flu_016373 [Riccia fluitans]|uniref:Uncharacterized protein n=1 Tax=Riccia fluitans TaxID=41844 RepID=A0ABD1YQJ2_9MARC